MLLAMTGLRPPSVHRVPTARLVDRVAEVSALVRGKSVIDLGFVDEGQLSPKREHGIWLHEQVAAAAREAVGIDADEQGVLRARELGFAAHVGDVEDEGSLAGLGVGPAEVVLAGELIEHLDRPGAFLEAVKQLVAPGGALVLTTPNGLALTFPRVQSGAALPRAAFNAYQTVLRPVFRLRPNLADGIIAVATPA